MRPQHPTGGWWLVVPVKDTERGKSRILAPVGIRRSVARALATDTLVAAAGSEEVAVVVAVTEIDRDARMAEAAGARTVVAGGHGLRAAIAAGLAVVPVGAAVAVLLGDVPAVRSAELSAVLRDVAPGETVFVADAAGTGTTLLAARDVPLRPHFGADSADLHRQAGFRDLAAGGEVPAGLRSDVDTLADLLRVRPLLSDLGSRTGALLDRDDVRAALTGTAVDPSGDEPGQHEARPR